MAVGGNQRFACICAVPSGGRGVSSSRLDEETLLSVEFDVRFVRFVRSFDPTSLRDVSVLQGILVAKRFREDIVTRERQQLLFHVAHGPSGEPLS